MKLDKQTLGLLDAAIDRHKGALYRLDAVPADVLREAVSDLVTDNFDNNELLSGNFRPPADDLDKDALAGVLIVHLLSTQKTTRKENNGQ